MTIRHDDLDGATLVEDLARLLREGLVCVEPDEEDGVPRFRVTRHGADVLTRTCDHTFRDSLHCVRCGWTPPEAA